MDIESKLLSALIITGLFALALVEITQIPHRPIVFVILLAIPITALIYKFLGGFGDNDFKTPFFRATGSAAFFLGFIFVINPILESQTIPKKKSIV